MGENDAKRQNHFKRNVLILSILVLAFLILQNGLWMIELFMHLFAFTIAPVRGSTQINEVNYHIIYEGVEKGYFGPEFQSNPFSSSPTPGGQTASFSLALWYYSTPQSHVINSITIDNPDLKLEKLSIQLPLNLPAGTPPYKSPPPQWPWPPSSPMPFAISIQMPFSSSYNGELNITVITS